MPRNKHGIAILLAAASAPVLGAGASACDWSIGSYLNGFIPDFDQKRFPGPLVFDGMNFVFEPPGLPGNGLAYCSPTAHTNTMAYLANHGFPALMPGGASSWQAAAEYKTVTEAIREMGMRMQTHPTEGTTCCGEAGCREYLDVHAPGKFTVASNFANKLSVPTLAQIAFCAQLSGFVNISVGWYSLTGPNQWDKTGGHVVSVVGVGGWCGSGARQISVRDPANGNTSYTQQSIFSTQTYTVTPQYGYYYDGDGVGVNVYYGRTHERMISYDAGGGTAGLIQGYRVIWPKLGVVISPLAQPSFDLHVPVRPTHPAGPIVQNLPIATSTPITDFAIDPTQLSILYTVEDAAGNPDPRVFQLDRTTGASQVVYTGLEAQAIECGRYRQFFIVDRSNLVMIDNEVDPPATTIRSTPSSLDVIVYDDTTDKLLCLSASAGTIVRYDGRDFSAAAQTFALPSGVALSGEAFMTVSPSDGAIWLRSKNSPNIYKMIFNAGGGLMVAGVANIPATVGDLGIDIDVQQTREHILLARQVGLVAEYEKDAATGAWIPSPGSSFAGLPCKGAVRLARSRSNFDNDHMAGPEWHEILPATFGASVFDCPGDLNGDGTVNAADLALMLGAWGPLAEGPADINSDGVVNSADLALLLGGWGSCR